MAGRFPTLLTLTAVIVLAAAPASATTVSREVDYDPSLDELSAEVSVASVSREADDFVVTRDERRLIFASRPHGRLLAGEGCKRHGERVVTCSRDHLTAIYINGAAGDDRVHVKLPRWRYVDLQVFGGAGDDELVIQGPDALIFGEGGDDLLVGGMGRDRLMGGGGRDRLRGREGEDALGGDGITAERGQPAADDRLDGGPGRDFATWGVWGTATAGVDADLAAGTGGRAGERDLLHSIEGLQGGDGPDVLRGDSGPNVLLGSAGRDRLFGRAGDDHLDLGGVEDDPIFYESSFGSDGVADRASCGAGSDAVRGTDDADVVAGDCETTSSKQSHAAAPMRSHASS